jgi:hypothetical protein
MYTNKVENDVPIPDKTSGQTQFYLKVDKDATKGTVSIVTSTTVPGSGDVCHYIIDWNTERKANLSVTVPLYVCMYGYGGDGSVVVPDEKAYAMENESKYSETKTVKDIEACYLVNQIDTYAEYYEKTYQATLEAQGKQEDKLSDEEKNALSEAVKVDLATTYPAYLAELNITEDKVNSGAYGYYIDGNTKTSVEYSKCVKHINDDCKDKDDKSNIDKYYYKVSKDSITDADGKFYKATGDDKTSESVSSGDLDVNVPTIEVETSTWKIGSADAINELQKEQIAMTINDLDLFQVYDADDQKLDIKDLGWVIPGDGLLQLPITAAIAGGSVNDDVNCVPVVRVIYTVAPAYDRPTPTPSAN